MAAPINNTLPPPTNGSGRRVVVEAENKLSVAGQSTDAASSSADQIDLSGAGLRLGRTVGAGGGDITTPQAAAAAVANLHQQMITDPATALAAYGNIRQEGLLPAPLA